MTDWYKQGGIKSENIKGSDQDLNMYVKSTALDCSDRFTVRN